MTSMLNGVSFSILVSSLYILRFRGWKRPIAVIVYFAFFAILEIGASYYFLPPGAFGLGLSFVCLGLSVPVLIAAYLVWRQEKRFDETD